MSKEIVDTDEARLLVAEHKVRVIDIRDGGLPSNGER